MMVLITTGCKANRGLLIFTSGISAILGVPWSVSAGHSSECFVRNGGPFIHLPFISRTEIPRLRSSAGLRLVGTYRQTPGSHDAWISATRTPTKDFSMVDSERSQANTIIESDHNTTQAGLILNSLQMVFASLVAIRAAISSRRGTVVWRRGATLALADTRRTSLPVDVDQTRYAAAPYARTLASAKTWSSGLQWTDGG